MTRIFNRMHLFYNVVACVCFCMIIHTPAYANKKYASIVMDADTGMILSQSNADKRLHPASLTKIMTLTLLFDAMDRGIVTPNTRIRVSRHAASMVPSKLDLPAGSSIKAKDAIYILVTKSANDIAVAVGEHLGNSEAGFADMMTRKARVIGMSNTTFRNASGLHHPKQVSTARDMAILAQYVINRYPKYYRYFSKKNFSYHGKNYKNHNKLLGTYAGMDGMKTGYVNASGFNLVASAVRDDRRIIGVVFGGRTGNSRNAHMKVLLDRGFNKIGSIRVAKADIPTPPRKPNNIGRSDTVATISPASGEAKASNGQAVIGQGSYDPIDTKRIATGFAAMEAHAHLLNPSQQQQQKRKQQPTGHNGTAPSASFWAIQIGAFKSRQAAESVIHQSQQALPVQKYPHVTQAIAPLKTRNGWLFRGRLSGFTRNQARDACQYFKDCMMIAPQYYASQNQARVQHANMLTAIDARTGR